jgi:hypothetical protein
VRVFVSASIQTRINADGGGSITYLSSLIRIRSAFHPWLFLALAFRGSVRYSPSSKNANRKRGKPVSSTTTPLPVGWSKILDEVHLRLDHAVAAADARIAQLPHRDASTRLHEKHQEIAKWNERLQRLGTFLESAEQIVHSVDEVLQKEETLLRQQLTAMGTLRQRLAEGTGRAIG